MANEQMKTKIELPSDKEILMTRTFDAPRDLVWKMWTEAEHLKHWWGPTGWTLPFCEVDFREGGTWLYCMKGPMPDGSEMESWGKATYNEIVAPERIVYTDAFVDSEGNEQEGMPIAEVSMEFIEQDGKTLVKSVTTYPTKEARDTVIEMGVEQGMDQTLNRLDEYLVTLA